MDGVNIKNYLEVKGIMHNVYDFNPTDRHMLRQDYSQRLCHVVEMFCRKNYWTDRQTEPIALPRFVNVRTG